MRQIVVKALKPLDAMSVENTARPGTPDINFIEGWIELKVLDHWPAKTDAVVKVPCFTPQQRVWLRRRVQLGGAAYFLIRIDQDWLLFDGQTAADQIGKMNKETMLQECLFCSSNRLDTRQLFRTINNGRRNQPARRE